MTPLQNCIHSNPHLIKYNRPYHGYVYFISDGDAVKVGLSRSTAMTIRQFRRLSRARRRQIIDSIEDPLTQRVLRCAFLGPGKRSWVQVALIIGGDNTPNTVCQIAHRGLNSVTFARENHDTIEP